MGSVYFCGRKRARALNRQLGCAASVLLALLLPASVMGQSSRPGMGATPYADAGGTGVTFRVWSPNATNVQVRGSFNGWGSTAMVEEGTSDLWSVDVPGVANNSQYKYFINNSEWWKDPRSRMVTQSGYKSGSANSIVYFPNAFNWMGDTRLPVTQSELVIYQLHIGAFHDPPGGGSPGKFTDAIAKLDHLTSLGINAIELLPISEFPGDFSWGYNPADIFAVENAGYGGPDGLKNLVKAAHARGIRVLLDMVHNHWGPNDFELYGFDVGSASRIYLYTNSGICCTPWGDRPNYASSGVRNFIKDNFRMWLDEYHVDGFRWDAVGAMRYYDAGSGNYLPIPEADTLIQEIHASIIDSNAISIAEDAAFGLSFDGEWDRGFGDNLISQVTKTNDADRDMNALWNGINGSGFFRVVYSETHDLTGNLNGAGAQRLPKRIDSAVPDSYAARKRSMLAAAVVLTMPGTPMLFMGQEMLEDEQFADNNPLDWAHTNTYAGVVNFYRDLIHLRRNLDGVSWGLTGPNVTGHVVRNDAPTKLLAFHRWGAGADDQVMVVMNFTSQAITNYAFNGWPANGAWYVNLNSDWTTYSPDFGNYGSSVVQVAGGAGSVSVGPYSTLVLSRKALPNLDSDADGLLNGWEQTHFGDPLTAVASQDNDQDGANNLAEQGAATDPNSAASVLKFTQISQSGGNVNLQWQGGTSVRQIIQRSVTLPGAWTNLHTNNAPTTVTNSLVIPSAPSGSAYYRIKAGP